ncbi:MAG: UxaA family hydrolase [Alphaproteobacteria bacterium]|nr:UxaA family hydrolase [Alphaproteobacteria bacterium SS10]
MSETPHLLVHEKADNVGVVVVEGLKAGTDMLCCITHDNSTFRLKAGDDVPIGHKIALVDLKTDDTAIKYGEDIGKIIADIPQGRHVHTHNCKTKRW